MFHSFIIKKSKKKTNKLKEYLRFKNQKILGINKNNLNLTFNNTQNVFNFIPSITNTKHSSKRVSFPNDIKTIYEKE